jgi:hypothetical protein
MRWANAKKRYDFDPSTVDEACEFLNGPGFLYRRLHPERLHHCGRRVDPQRSHRATPVKYCSDAEAGRSLTTNDFVII